MDLKDATLDDMIAELERRGLRGSIVTRHLSDEVAFGAKLKRLRVIPIPGLLPKDLPAGEIEVRLTSDMRSECALPAAHLLAAVAFVMTKLPVMEPVTIAKKKAMETIKQALTKGTRTLWTLTGTNED